MAPGQRKKEISVDPSRELTIERETSHSVADEELQPAEGESAQPAIRKGTRLRRSSEKKKLATTAETTQIKRHKNPAKKQLSREKVSGKKKAVQTQPVETRNNVSPEPEFIGFSPDATELLARDILEGRVRLARDKAVSEGLEREIEEAGE